MKKEVFLECGCCGQYHPEEFQGDCRDDDNRYLYEEIPTSAVIVSLGDQIEED